MATFNSNECLQFSSVAQSCPTLCDPMNHSMPGLPGHHPLPEFINTSNERGDTIGFSIALKRIIREYYEKLHANIVDIKGELNKCI